jgi:hypothetical protein
MNGLKALISDGNGDPSTMRVLTILFSLALIVPKVVISIRTSNPVVFDSTDLEIIGVILGAKAAQSFAENKTPATPPPAPTPPKP